MLKNSKNKIIIITIFIIIFIGLVIRNIHLSSTPFYDWDEGMYAQIAKEIINNRSIFTTFNGQVWLDKPPLVHILIAGMFLLFGLSEFWARMLPVFFSFILLILTYLSAKKLYSFISLSKMETIDKLFAPLIPVLLLAASPVFMDRVALLNSDVPIAICWMGYLLYQEQYWVKFFFLTLGVWSKSVLGFYPLVFDFNTIKFFLQTKKIKIPSLIFFLLIPSLWYIAGLIKYGKTFIYNHFESQVLKRVSVPIELHIGNKFYYLAYLWKTMGLINIVFIIGCILFFFQIYKQILQEKKKFINEKNLFVLSLLLTPFPFFIFLNFMKTKIYWYVIMFFPFLCLSSLYVYFFLKKKLYRILFFIGVATYFVINFSVQTYFSKTLNITNERIILAKCLAKTPYKSVGFLVDENEREIQNVLEAAHYDTTSSFYYGGSPSFVFYLQKALDYYYSVNDFIANHKKHSLLISSKKDVQNDPTIAKIFSNKKTICRDETWLTIVEK